MIRILHTVIEEMPVEKLVNYKSEKLSFRFIYNERSDAVHFEIRRKGEFLYSSKLVYGVQSTGAITAHDLPYVACYRPEDFEGKFPGDVAVTGSTLGRTILFYFEDGQS